MPVSASPTGILTTPDAVLSALQSNPISIVVQCANIPLNTQITVTVTPVNGPPVTATGYNNTGTLASSTATVDHHAARRWFHLRLGSYGQLRDESSELDERPSSHQTAFTAEKKPLPVVWRRNG